MADIDALIRDYARLTVHVGVNLQPGQDVLIRADFEHAPVARAIAVEAYESGARRVEVVYDDTAVRRAELLHAPEQTLASVPGWRLEQLREMERDGSAFIRLTGAADPHVFDGIDPARISIVPEEYVVELRKLMLSGAIPWTVVAAPNAGWAEQVFGEPDVERLWEVVAVSMRLDEADVVVAWHTHRATLAARADTLTTLELDKVHYYGPGTDLTVGLLPGSRWVSGSLTSRAGVEYMPNLPTEEVFTSPDRRRADGTMRLSRPLVMPQQRVMVEGLQVTFEGGRIVDATAEAGLDAVLAELDRDPGARSLGEVAIVDRSSRIRQAGVVFHDTLYDENAGSHVAWGQSFSFVLDGGTDHTQDELFDLGLNHSQAHTDVVIGGPGVSIDGISADGTVTPIVADDVWVLPVRGA
jgi:aminopeptidase